jgi:hypothetical protein
MNAVHILKPYFHAVQFTHKVALPFMPVSPTWYLSFWFSK